MDVSHAMDSLTSPNRRSMSPSIRRSASTFTDKFDFTKDTGFTEGTASEVVQDKRFSLRDNSWTSRQRSSSTGALYTVPESTSPRQRTRSDGIQIQLVEDFTGGATIISDPNFAQYLRPPSLKEPNSRSQNPSRSSSPLPDPFPSRSSTSTGFFNAVDYKKIRSPKLTEEVPIAPSDIKVNPHNDHTLLHGFDLRLNEVETAAHPNLEKDYKEIAVITPKDMHDVVINIKKYEHDKYEFREEQVFHEIEFTTDTKAKIQWIKYLIELEEQSAKNSLRSLVHLVENVNMKRKSATKRSDSGRTRTNGRRQILLDRERKKSGYPNLANHHREASSKDSKAPNDSFRLNVDQEPSTPRQFQNSGMVQKSHQIAATHLHNKLQQINTVHDSERPFNKHSSPKHPKIEDEIPFMPLPEELPKDYSPQPLPDELTGYSDDFHLSKSFTDVKDIFKPEKQGRSSDFAGLPPISAVKQHILTAAESEADYSSDTDLSDDDAIESNQMCDSCYDIEVVVLHNDFGDKEKQESKKVDGFWDKDFDEEKIDLPLETHEKTRYHYDTSYITGEDGADDSKESKSGDHYSIAKVDDKLDDEEDANMEPLFNAKVENLGQPTLDESKWSLLNERRKHGAVGGEIVGIYVSKLDAKMKKFETEETVDVNFIFEVFSLFSKAISNLNRIKDHKLLNFRMVYLFIAHARNLRKQILNRFAVNEGESFRSSHSKIMKAFARVSKEFASGWAKWNVLAPTASESKPLEVDELIYDKWSRDMVFDYELKPVEESNVNKETLVKLPPRILELIKAKFKPNINEIDYLVALKEEVEKENDRYYKLLNRWHRQATSLSIEQAERSYHDQVVTLDDGTTLIIPTFMFSMNPLITISSEYIKAFQLYEEGNLLVDEIEVRIQARRNGKKDIFFKYYD